MKSLDSYLSSFLLVTTALLLSASSPTMAFMSPSMMRTTSSSARSSLLALQYQQSNTTQSEKQDGRYAYESQQEYQLMNAWAKFEPACKENDALQASLRKRRSNTTTTTVAEENKDELYRDMQAWAKFEPKCKDNDSLQAALRVRQDELKRGIGLRYVVRGPAVKIHSSMTDGPYCTENIVGFLQEGDIVTSKDRIGKYWIKHDQGWTYTYRDGGVMFQPIKQ